jgi:hypothetical protein
MAEGFITRRGGKGGVDVSDATALTTDVLSGKTFYASDEQIKTGTIPSKSAQTFTPGTTNQTIAAGQYLEGTQTILGDADLIPENIRQSTNIFGVTGTLIPQPTLSATGGTITTYTSGGKNYRVHTFTSSGNFVVSEGSTNVIKNNEVDYLIIAGGAGGHFAEGGGAGGYLTSNGTSGENSSQRLKYNVITQTYSVVVGAGGAQNSDGANSSVFNLIALSGGKNKGGSGTGGSLGSRFQGFDGGTNTSNARGGGGGAGQVGANASGSIGGNGGNGLANTLRTGSNETRAGGGGGAGSGGAGSGGDGGGGNGGVSVGTSGAANTGSGGGGGWISTNGSGGSGIVIIRYEVA